MKIIGRAAFHSEFPDDENVSEIETPSANLLAHRAYSKLSSLFQFAFMWMNRRKKNIYIFSYVGIHIDFHIGMIPTIEMAIWNGGVKLFIEIHLYIVPIALSLCVCMFVYIKNVQWNRSEKNENKYNDENDSNKRICT